MQKNKSVSRWLISLYGLIVVMIMIGGITRLTGSGLSMVDWRPVFGFLPPITEEGWLSVFGQYQQSPQYLKVNQGMGLTAFKSIFVWEYLHRVLGRVIGLWVLLPWIYFLIKNRLTLTQKWQGGIMVLGIGFQGWLGWFMVKSGLVNMPQVSHFRLASHLLTALLIMALVLWTWLSNRSGRYVPKPNIGSIKPMLGALVFSFVLQLIFGVFTAGLKAGYYYPTYPKMGGEWLPQSAWMLEPWWGNVINNPIMIQFIHRWLAMIVVISTGSFITFVFMKGLSHLKRPIVLLAAAVVVQVILGILTIVLSMPLTVAILHQFGAVLIVSILVWIIHEVYHEDNHEKHDFT